MFYRNPNPRLLALAATLLLAPIAAVAQAPQSPPIHGLAHIAIRVHDVDAASAFYRKLGYQQAFAFHKIKDDPASPISQAFIKVNDRQFIELYPTSNQPDNQPSYGFLHLCFDGDDLNALQAFDVSQGLPANAVRKAGAGNLLFTLRGPENQNIEYTQYMPGSLHYQDRGQHLNPAQDPAGPIADNFFAVGLAMHDVPAALAFYTAKLAFPTAKGSQTLLLIPGSQSPTATGTLTSQQILLEPLHGTASRIFLYVPDLKKAAATLKQRGIPATPGRHSLTVNDPDGNSLVFTTDTEAR